MSQSRAIDLTKRRCPTAAKHPRGHLGVPEIPWRVAIANLGSPNRSV